VEARHLSLPPGQHAIADFPRFGSHRSAPPPRVAEPSMIRVEGAVARRLEVPLARLAALPRRALIADFHCVAGWTAPGLHWSGVPFRSFYEKLIVPEARPDLGVSHVLFRGADGYRSVLTLEDALDDEVLLADQLGGVALGGDHGAPLRLLSPAQYGYKSAKHLCGIELHTRALADGHESALPAFALALLGPHPRARVALEERHRLLPTWLVRGPYWKLARALLWAARRESAD
jgi:DMSO/TMAO reductase YedYZ molybdopterin-dependent catalytic subunit